MRLFIFLFLIAFSFSGVSQINFFEGSWADVINESKKTEKPILVDAYTTWCGPCKWMASTTFMDQQVGSYVNANYVAYKLDMENGEGIEFAKTNQVMAYPTILFFTSDGELVHKAVGAQGAEDFLALVKRTSQEENQYIRLKKRFEDGDRDKDFIKDYIAALNEAGETDRSAFDIYWTNLKDNEKQTIDGFWMMHSETKGFSDIDDPLFSYYIDHRNVYDELLSPEERNYISSQSYRLAMRKALLSEPSEAKLILKRMESIFTERSGELYEHYNYSRAVMSEDEKAIIEAEKAYLKVTSDWELLNSMAWAIYEGSDNQADLQKALTYINRSLKINTTYANMDTKAAVLYKLGKYKKAQKSMQKALKLAANEDPEMDVSASLLLLSKIEEKL